MSSTATQGDSRFGKGIERPDGRDFPFYNAVPTEIQTWKWIVVLVACVVGFAVLITIPQPNQFVALIPRILFPAIPLVTFAVLVRPQGRAVFHRVTGRDVLTMIVFWVINLAVTSVIAIIVKSLFGANANAATDAVTADGPLGVAAFYVGTGVQLLGEELFTLLPFLAILYWSTKLGLGRKRAVVLAWVVTAIGFGAAHLPTYGWNVAQALLVIGVARLVLTLAFIRTKNIWVSTGAHILNDWSTFTLVILTGIAISS